MSRPRVSLLAHDNYDRGETLARMRELLRPLGGMERFVRPGGRVMFKPNLVFGRDSASAVNTHPEVFRAAARLAREAGAAWIGLGDSPGRGSARAAAGACGLAGAAEEEGARLVEFTPEENVDPESPFVRLELARELLAADVVINLPKMKTHGQMLLTLAVKNMFGAVPGARKLQWHYRAGRDRRLFARMINEVARRARPRLSIIDAVVGMDGLGPTAGRARPVGFLGAADDPWALDAAVMDVLGLDRDLLPTLAAAREHGPREWIDCEILGDSPAALRPADWEIPELRTLQMHGGLVEKRLPWLAAWLRRRLTRRPVAKTGCVACGYCVGICPAGAMRLENGRLHIDHAACIRCFCCHELCRHDGIDLAGGGVLPRLLGIS